MIGAGVTRPKSSAGVRVAANTTNNFNTTSNYQVHNASDGIDKKLGEHATNTNVRNSGYLTNFATGDGKGWGTEDHMQSI